MIRQKCVKFVKRCTLFACRFIMHAMMPQVERQITGHLERTWQCGGFEDHLLPSLQFLATDQLGHSEGFSLGWNMLIDVFLTKKTDVEILDGFMCNKKSILTKTKWFLSLSFSPWGLLLLACPVGVLLLSMFANSRTSNLFRSTVTKRLGFFTGLKILLCLLVYQLNVYFQNDPTKCSNCWKKCFFPSWNSWKHLNLNGWMCRLRSWPMFWTGALEQCWTPSVSAFRGATYKTNSSRWCYKR